MRFSRFGRGNPPGQDASQARREAVIWARSVVVDQSAVFLDTETTGLDGQAEIIEISLLDIQGNVLLDTLVRPQTMIPPDATRVHGISNQMVREAPDWPQVFSRLVPLAQGRRVVVYNADFDARMVSQMNARHRIRSSPAGWQCAMKQFSGFAGIWNEKYGNYRWHRLDDAAARFGHPPGGHRALSDARACKLVVEGIAGTSL